MILRNRYDFQSESSKVTSFIFLVLKKRFIEDTIIRTKETSCLSLRQAEPSSNNL